MATGHMMEQYLRLWGSMEWVSCIKTFNNWVIDMGGNKVVLLDGNY